MLFYIENVFPNSNLMILGVFLFSCKFGFVLNFFFLFLSFFLALLCLALLHRHTYFLKLFSAHVEVAAWKAWKTNSFSQSKDSIRNWRADLNAVPSQFNHCIYICAKSFIGTIEAKPGHFLLTAFIQLDTCTQKRKEQFMLMVREHVYTWSPPV